MEAMKRVHMATAAAAAALRLHASSPIFVGHVRVHCPVSVVEMDKHPMLALLRRYILHTVALSVVL